jgi:hypothetical protein
LNQIPELKFLKSMGLETEEEEGYRTGPPGYIGWQNSFLGIDSGAPYALKNTGSVSLPTNVLVPKALTESMLNLTPLIIRACNKSIYNIDSP